MLQCDVFEVSQIGLMRTLTFKSLLLINNYYFKITIYNAFCGMFLTTL